MVEYQFKNKRLVALAYGQDNQPFCLAKETKNQLTSYTIINLNEGRELTEVNVFRSYVTSRISIDTYRITSESEFVSLMQSGLSSCAFGKTVCRDHLLYVARQPVPYYGDQLGDTIVLTRERRPFFFRDCLLNCLKKYRSGACRAAENLEFGELFVARGGEYKVYNFGGRVTRPFISPDGATLGFICRMSKNDKAVFIDLD